MKITGLVLLIITILIAFFVPQDSNILLMPFLSVGYLLVALALLNENEKLKKQNKELKELKEKDESKEIV
ncbi:hypothetical protein SDC9_07865 [bioreactor metagenome]|uniref:Uncharacterized protein n=1 Tax=bioreactor metagenome TaxID=1076179 RepID=A0A644T608_9ZZZZ|nr:hypothetical protein [Candidatus Elulimicrobiales bacterium]